MSQVYNYNMHLHIQFALFNHWMVVKWKYFCIISRWEKYDAKGSTEKKAYKYGRLNEQSWWEKWGEYYDGRGFVAKWFAHVSTSCLLDKNSLWQYFSVETSDLFCDHEISVVL